jgi:carbohydrate phosphorylase/pyridine nucleotide-disulfide oxidoreductase
MDDRVPCVVIVGGGFGGLAAAKALRKTPARVLLIDRTNHHLFQPLLYQVATAVLATGQIASPIREILRRQQNATVILGEVTGVDVNHQSVLVNSADREDVPIPYDYLVLATGARHSYFGHDEYEEFAPGLKSLADAVAARNRILQAFEQAEAEEDPSRHRDLLTFVLVGAGATGVEMAGAFDRPVVGYGGKTINTLRLWAAAAPDYFDFQAFSHGDFVGALAQTLEAESLTRVLYPDDSTTQGQGLRFVQEYFLVACSLADLVRRFRRANADWSALPEKVAVQLNDTHPAVAVEASSISGREPTP